MTACIGWVAEPECPIHGWVHGCDIAAPHGGREHRCACGATCKRAVERASRGSTIRGIAPGRMAENGSSPASACDANRALEDLTWRSP